MKYSLGIDPGKSGGVSLVGLHDVECLPMPELNLDLFNFLKFHRSEIAHACLEKSQPMPKQGVVSVYSYGHHNGVVEGFLISLGIPYTLLKPQAWMKDMHVGADSKLGTKERSIQVAQRLFPTVNLLPGRKTKPHDGMAESLLIAEYCRRLHG